MLAMRAMIALQPAADLGPGGRAAFDALMERTPAAAGVAYEAATVGGVPGWWCRPADVAADAVILYLHGGAYVVGSAQAYRHLVGQIAVRTRTPAFVADLDSRRSDRSRRQWTMRGSLSRSGQAIGFSAISIAGDSAGGGLALVAAARMAQAARNGSVSRPVAIAVLSRGPVWL